MLDAEITGETHPKTVVLVSDDKEGENIALVEGFEDWEFDALAEKARVAGPYDHGPLKIEVPKEDVGDVIDFLEDRFYGSPAHLKLEELRIDAVAQAQAHRQQGSRQ